MIPRHELANPDDLISIIKSRDIDMLREYAEACQDDDADTENDFWQEDMDQDERRILRQQLRILAQASATALKIVLDDHDWISAEGAAHSICRPQTGDGQRKGYEHAMSV